MPVVNIDPKAGFEPGLLGGGTVAVAIVPSDTDDLAIAVRGIWVGVTGTIRVRTVGGSDVTFPGVPVGLFDCVRVAKVFATGTTATSMIGIQ